MHDFKSEFINGNGRPAEVPAGGESVKSSAEDKITVDTARFQIPRMAKAQAPKEESQNAAYPTKGNRFDEPREATSEKTPSDAQRASEIVLLDAADWTIAETLGVTVSSASNEAHTTTEDEVEIQMLTEATTLLTATDSLISDSETNYRTSRGNILRN